MNTTSNQRGMIFSTDAMLSFVILLFTLLVFSLYSTELINRIEQNLTKIELDQKAVFVADTLVKNQCTENAVLGACEYDAEKKRVNSNQLNYFELKNNSNPISFGEIIVKKIELIFLGTNKVEEILLTSETNFSECTSVKRFVLINSQKVIIEVTTCRQKS